jgi:hypothetical protein
MSKVERRFWKRVQEGQIHIRIHREERENGRDVDSAGNCRCIAAEQDVLYTVAFRQSLSSWAMVGKGKTCLAMQ